MNIFWFGQACFQITTAKNKEKEISIVIDPFSEEIGLKLLKMEADILLLTRRHPDYTNKKIVSGNYFLISGPGEYEIKNIFIQGIASFHDNSRVKEGGENTIYTIETEELKICHLGDLGQKELSEEQLELIGDIDVLMLPVGGNFTIAAKEAVKIMSQIEPKIIIPMYYALPKLKIKLDGVDKFLKALGIKKIEPLKKLSVKKKEISPEEVKIVLLEPRKNL